MFWDVDDLISTNNLVVSYKQFAIVNTIGNYTAFSKVKHEKRLQLRHEGENLTQ
jgi:hypothetical protein